MAQNHGGFYMVDPQKAKLWEELYEASKDAEFDTKHDGRCQPVSPFSGCRVCYEARQKRRDRLKAAVEAVSPEFSRLVDMFGHSKKP